MGTQGERRWGSGAGAGQGLAWPEEQDLTPWARGAGGEGGAVPCPGASTMQWEGMFGRTG